MAEKSNAGFFTAIVVVVGLLAAFGAYRAGILAPEGEQEAAPVSIDPSKLASVGPTAEADDANGITTVKEYAFTPSERLPDVKGTAQYKPMEDNTVRFALNVWAGWAPIILANEGFDAGKVWKAADGTEFKVELVLIDNPVVMRDAYAAGEVHIGWATLDMLPLFMEGFVDTNGKPKDSRIMPRVYQQVDWSNGGDGIVVRAGIKTVADLRGKRIVLAENSPSHYFLLNMLVAGGVQPSEVKLDFTTDAFEAAAAFNAEPEIAAVVSWAPDIYNLESVEGNRLLVTTATANKLIADVWFARADFANDHPDIVEGLVRGIFDAIEDMKGEAKKKQCAELMGAGFNLPADEALAMMGDAHSTNWSENYQFFMNQNNPANFERVWRQAYYLYGKIRSIRHRPVSFDRVMDFSIIEKLGKDEKYSSQKDDYTVQFAPKPTLAVRAEEEILTNTVVIHFYPNSWDLRLMIEVDHGSGKVRELYDPKVDYVIEKIGELAGSFGAARIIIEGHTDSSMKGKVPAALVKDLSTNRANAVKEAVVQKFELDINRFNIEGLGWDKAADEDDPLNHAKNRRVEIKVFRAEAD